MPAYTRNTVLFWNEIFYAQLDKRERLRALVQVAEMLPEKLFWRYFGKFWAQSENLFQDQPVIEEWLRDHQHSPNRALMMSAVERRALKHLPVRFKIYRGCFNQNQEGWSWTLKLDRAKMFAKRMPTKGHPLIVVGYVCKDDVIAYKTDRDEYEIVVDPFMVEVVETKKLPLFKPPVGSMMYLLAQTGAFDQFDPRMRIGALAAAKMAGTTYEHLTKHFTESERTMRELGFIEKADKIAAFIAVAKEVYEDPQYPTKEQADVLVEKLNAKP